MRRKPSRANHAAAPGALANARASARRVEIEAHEFLVTAAGDAPPREQRGAGAERVDLADRRAPVGQQLGETGRRAPLGRGDDGAGLAAPRTEDGAQPRYELARSLRRRTELQMDVRVDEPGENRATRASPLWVRSHRDDTPADVDRDDARCEPPPRCSPDERAPQLRGGTTVDDWFPRGSVQQTRLRTGSGS